jgi:hypothetical protein
VEKLALFFKVALIGFALVAPFSSALAFNGGATANGASPAVASPADDRAVAQPTTAAPGALATAGQCPCRKVHPHLTPEQIAERRAKQAENLARLSPEQLSERRARQAERRAQLTPEQIAERRERQAALRALPACPPHN